MFFLALYFLDGKGILEVLNKNVESDKDISHHLAIGPNAVLLLDLVSNLLQILSRHHVAVVASMYLISIVWFVATIGNSNYVGR